jgi:hypothetical protein
MSAVNPYRSRAHCRECDAGSWVIYNIGFPDNSDKHTIRLCERHYRQAENAARRFELSLLAP